MSEHTEQWFLKKYWSYFNPAWDGLMHYAYMYYIHLINTYYIQKHDKKEEWKAGMCFMKILSERWLDKKKWWLGNWILIKTVNSAIMTSFVLLVVIFILHDIFK